MGLIDLALQYWWVIYLVSIMLIFVVAGYKDEDLKDDIILVLLWPVLLAIGIAFAGVAWPWFLGQFLRSLKE